MKNIDMKKEITGLRDRYTKHYDLGNGLRQAVVYPQPVHFQDAGGWQEIDNTLKPAQRDGKPVYRNAASPVSAEFAQSIGSGMLAHIEYEGHTLEWGLEQPDAMSVANEADQLIHTQRAAKLRNNIYDAESALPNVSGAEVTYEEAAPGIDLRCRLESTRCKEDIIVKNRAAAANAVIRVKGPGLAFRLQDDEQIEVYDKTAGDTAPVFTFMPPFALDHSGDEAEEPVRIVMTETDDGVILRYVLSDDYLDKAVYPIVIDPTVNVSNETTNLDDTFVCQNHTTTNYNTKGYMECGWQDNNKTANIALLRFKQLASITAGDTIVKAQLRLTPKSSYRTNPKYVGAYAMTKDWNASTITWNSFVALDGMDTDVQDCIIRSDSTYVYFDITNLCRTWYTKKDGVSQNFGLALRRPDLENNTVWHYVQFYSRDGSSSYAPLLTITYVSHVGQEQRWNYQSLSAGRAGVMAAELFNGNTVVTHVDIAMDGLRNPISIAHTYNSCECEDDSCFCGYGWRTSMHQSIHSEILGSDTYYVWTDGDGTKHYFKITGNTSPYSDEDGLHLKLTYNTTTATITDLQDNTMTFTKQSGWNKYWLTQLSDCLNNAITISHQAEGKIGSVTDPVGKMVLYAYDDSNRLALLYPYVDSGTGGYPYGSYTYNSSGNLIRIVDSDIGNGATYTYDGHLLTVMQNYDGLAVQAVYESIADYNPDAFSGTLGQQMMRVKSMEQKNVNNSAVLGSMMLFDYRHMSTHMTMRAGSAANAANDHQIIYQFNDRGNIVSVRDELGYAYYKTYDSSYPNYPDVASRLQRTSVNMLANHSFETTSDWTTSTAGGATGTHSYASDYRRQGSKAAKMNRTNTSGTMAISQTVSVTYGERYTLSCWARTDSSAVNVRAQVASGYTWSGLKQTSVGEWSRISVSFTAYDSTATVSFQALDGVGNAWFDCAQLEPGDVANRYNMLENGSFERVSGSAPLNWTAKSENNASTEIVYASGDSLHPDYLGGNVLQIIGYPNKNKGFYQDIVASGSAGDVFTVGGWARGKSRPIDTERKRFCMRVQFYSTASSDWVDGGMVNWNEEWTDWQYASGGVKAPAAYSKIRFYLDYEKNVNSASFDGLALYREAFGEEYAYNSDGRLVHTTTMAGNRDTRLYDTYGNFAQYAATGVTDHDTYMHFGFDGEPNKKHLLRYSNSPEYVQDVYEYDAYGNMTAHKRQDTTPSVAIRTTKTYTDNGDRLASQTDSRGNSTSYAYNTNGTVSQVTAPNGQTVNYTYDAQKRVTAVNATANGMNHKNAYTYSNDRLTTVSHNTTGDTNDVTYTFGYDALGKPTTVKVGTQTLSTNVYDSDRLQKLGRVEYGNGQSVYKYYDDYGREIGTFFGDDTVVRFRYYYGANGQINKLSDNNLGRVIWNEHDEANRPIRLTEQDSSTGELIRQAAITYDTAEHVASFKEKIGGSDYTTTYSYDYDDRLTELRYGSSSYRTRYTYDGQGRLLTRRINNGSADQTATYSYLGSSVAIPGLSTTPSTNLVSSINQPGVSFYYGYDSQTANITGELRYGGSYGGTTTYEYDTLGQLKRVNDPTDTTAGSTGTTWVFNYDRGGNMTSKVKYAYTTGTLGSALQTITFTYGDSNWKDKLTVYNGYSNLTYDAIGNLTNYAGWTYTWEGGRQLKKQVQNTTVVTYDYNNNGLRTRKVYSNTDGYVYWTMNYFYNGTQLTHLTKGSEWMHFYYDGQGRPAIVNYNGSYYHYLYNLQGDVIGMVDNTGTLVVEYKYNAWGSILGRTGSLVNTLGALNPFRYRGYVYDDETAMCYCRSRYYYPELQRFINADILLGKTGTLFSHNLYCYCANDPVICYDPLGYYVSFIPAFDGVGDVDSISQMAPPIYGVAGGEVLSGSISFGNRVVAVSLGIAPVALFASEIVGSDALSSESTNISKNSYDSFYTVYGLTDPLSNEVVYIGRTKNFGKRMYAHNRPGSRTQGLIPTIRIDNLTYNEARGLEEIGMIYYHTRKFLFEQGINLIHGISPTNKNIDVYLDAASRRCDYLYNRMDNTYLCWLEGI